LRLLKRRDFISSIAIGGAGICLVRPLFGAHQTPVSMPEFVESIGMHVDDLYSLSLEALGGLSAFSERGAKVLIKPTMHVLPRNGQVRTSSPALVRRVVEHCAEIRASRVTVLDSTLDLWMETYDQSGIERAAKDGGAKVLQANNDRFFKAWPHSPELLKLHEAYLEADVVINVTLIHSDQAGQYFGCIRNMAGVISPREQVDKDYDALAQLFALKKPTLNIAELRGENTRLLVSADVLAVENRVRSFVGHSKGLPFDVFEKFEMRNIGSRHYQALRYQKIES
jgi:hypothetical protein